MVLEAIINPLTAERRPWEMFFIGLLYSTVALFLGLWIFPEQASLVMIFLVVIACIPLIYSTFKLEERKDTETKEPKESFLLKEHGKAISFLIILFLGMTVAFVIWYVALPHSTVQGAFSVQAQTIASINNRVTANSVQIDTFNKILLNNIKVTIFCIIFSLLYGTGAIFILSWNASVLGAAIGNFIRTNISIYAQSIGMPGIAAYMKIWSLGFLKYTIHGIPEMLAYFIAGLAGGIISIAVIRHKPFSQEFNRVMYDSLNLLLLSLIVVVVAAFIEVYVSHALFRY